MQQLLQKSAPLFNTHAGRDKVIRLIQYFLLFLLPTLKDRMSRLGPGARDVYEKIVMKMAILYTQCSLTRKVLRFGMQIPLILGMSRRFQEHQKAPVKMILFQTLADVFGVLYNSCDHPNFFLKIGFIKNWSEHSVARWSRMTEFWWFLQSVCEVMVHIVHIQDFQT